MSERGASRWGPRTLVAASVLGLAIVGAAGPARATVVHEVTIDCAGDVVTGHAQVAMPAQPSAAVALYGWTGGTRHLIRRASVALHPNVTEVRYRFTLDRHASAYQVTVQNGATIGFSVRIADETCAPPVEVPEAGVALAVPGAMGVAGLVWWLRRRRSVPR